MRSNTLRSLASALALVATMQAQAQAQTGAFPSRALKIVVPTAPSTSPKYRAVVSEPLPGEVGTTILSARLGNAPVCACACMVATSARAEARLRSVFECM